MRFSNSVAAVFNLADSLTLVLGAQTIEEIVNNLVAAETEISNANAQVNTSPFDIDVFESNMNNIAANVKLYDSALGGTPILTVTDQLTLSNATGGLFGGLLGAGVSAQGFATAFINIGSQLQTLGASFNSLNNAMVKYGTDLQALAPNEASTIASQLSAAEQAFAALNATLAAAGA